MNKIILLFLLMFPTLTKAQTVINLAVNQLPELKIEVVGNDTTIVFGESIKLGTKFKISGGSGNYTYNWTPSRFLSDTTILSPLAFPIDTTEYLLTVLDNNGCSAALKYIVNVRNKTTNIKETKFANRFLETRLYPNPNNGCFSVELSGPVKDKITITVIDYLGRKVYEKEIEKKFDTQTVKIDIQLSKGMYALLIKSDNQHIQSKFIVR